MSDCASRWPAPPSHPSTFCRVEVSNIMRSQGVLRCQSNWKLQMDANCTVDFCPHNPQRPAPPLSFELAATMVIAHPSDNKNEWKWRAPKMWLWNCLTSDTKETWLLPTMNRQIGESWIIWIKSVRSGVHLQVTHLKSQRICSKIDTGSSWWKVVCVRRSRHLWAVCHSDSRLRIQTRLGDGGALSQPEAQIGIPKDPKSTTCFCCQNLASAVSTLGLQAKASIPGLVSQSAVLAKLQQHWIHTSHRHEPWPEDGAASKWPNAMHPNASTNAMQSNSMRRQRRMPCSIFRPLRSPYWNLAAP